MSPCRGALQHLGAPRERAVPRLHPMGLAEVTWGHLWYHCSFSLPAPALPLGSCCSQPRRGTCQPWSHPATCHPGTHLRACPPWSHPVPSRLGCDFCPLPGWAIPRAALHPRPRLCHHNPKPWQQARGILGIFLCSTVTENPFL